MRFPPSSSCGAHGRPRRYYISIQSKISLCARPPWHRRGAPLPWHPRQARLPRYRRRRRFGAPRFFPDRTDLGKLKADDHPTGHPHTIIHVCIGIVDGHGSLGSLGNQGCARPPSTAASVPSTPPIRRPEIFSEK